MKKLHILFIGILMAGTAFAADDLQSVESEAARMYQEGDYAKAIELYNQILDSDRESAAVYYNLGNAYYKTGETAKAILNYERALLIQPGDKDAKYNLAMAQRSTVDNISEILTKRGVDAALIQNFIDVLDNCEFARYAPDSGKNEEMDKVYRSSLEVITKLDKAI